jgi:hypothetical protein
MRKILRSLERQDDPNGYDIWKFRAHGHPMYRDPETILSERGMGQHWDLGEVDDKISGRV